MASKRWGADLIRKIDRVAIVSRQTAAVLIHGSGRLMFVLMAMIVTMVTRRWGMAVVGMPAEVAVGTGLVSIGSCLRSMSMCVERASQLPGEVCKQQQSGEAVTEH